MAKWRKGKKSHSPTPTPLPPPKNENLIQTAKQTWVLGTRFTRCKFHYQTKAFFSCQVSPYPGSLNRGPGPGLCYNKGTPLLPVDSKDRQESMCYSSAQLQCQSSLLERFLRQSPTDPPSQKKERVEEKALITIPTRVVFKQNSQLPSKDGVLLSTRKFSYIQY